MFKKCKPKAQHHFSKPMQIIQTLTTGDFFHIYNCGINGTPLFNEPDNYIYFMGLYQKHITPIADTYAWCLMGNHFHFLVSVKEVVDDVINDDVSTPTGFKNLSGFDATDINNPDKPQHQYFSNLFNAYSKAFNKRFNRHGSLFERPFKRKLVNDDSYLKNLVLYIHNNPVHHGFVRHPLEYPWSSYHEIMSKDETFVKRDEVLDWFCDVENYKQVHESKSFNIIEMEKYLEL